MMPILKKTFAIGATAAIIWGTLLAGASSTTAQSRPGGKEMESARQRFAREDWEGVLNILQRLPKGVDAAVLAESEILTRRARLGRALAWADADAGQGKERDAASEFESLAAGPQDITAGSARIARAAIAWRQKQPEDARRWMRQGFEAWRALQEKRPSPEKGSLEEEVLAVLETQFRPGPFRTPPYRLAPSIIRVDLKNGPSLDVTVNNSLRDAPGVIFVNDEQEAFLKTLLSRFRAERAVFFSDQKPSSGQPPQILEFINEFSFAGYRLLGGMKQWRLEWVVLASFPTSISFQDDLRVRAEVCSEDDTGGSCNFYEKRDGVWVFVQNGRIWSINTGGG